jgi:hypothetical protein
MITGCTGNEEEPNWNIVGDNSCRKVFKIDVGNIPEEEIEDYVRKVAQKFKKTSDTMPDLCCGIYNLPDSDIYYPPKVNTNKAMYYMQTIPNSHYWTDLKQIVYSIEHELERQKYESEKHPEDEYTVRYVGEHLTKDYILIGLGNSLTHGYKFKLFSEETFINWKGLILFTSLEDMIEYVQSEKFNFEDFRDMINNTINAGFNLTNGMKMERTEIYKRLNGERDYQDAKWGSRRQMDGTPDEEKPVAEWINYMEYHIAKAKERVYHLDTEGATAEIRKVTALGVRAMEIHGCPERDK